MNCIVSPFATPATRTRQAEWQQVLLACCMPPPRLWCGCCCADSAQLGRAVGKADCRRQRQGADAWFRRPAAGRPADLRAPRSPGTPSPLSARAHASRSARNAAGAGLRGAQQARRGAQLLLESRALRAPLAGALAHSSTDPAPRARSPGAPWRAECCLPAGSWCGCSTWRPSWRPRSRLASCTRTLHSPSRCGGVRTSGAAVACGAPWRDTRWLRSNSIERAPTLSAAPPTVSTHAERDPRDGRRAVGMRRGL